MSAGIAERLRTFAGEALEASGGVVEWHEGEAEVLAPPEVARIFHAEGDSFRLATQPGPGRVFLSLGSDFLDLAGEALARQVPRVAYFVLGERSLKKSDFHDLVDRQYQWLNARVRFVDAAPEEIEYHTWWFHASLRSDDYWETVVSATVNERSGNETALGDPLELFDVRESRAPSDPPATEGFAAAVASRRLIAAASGFLTRLDQRRQRDEQRLRSYYNALRREAGEVNRRTKTPPTEEEVAAKKRAVELELRRKLEELQERYQMQGRLTPIAVACLRTPVMAVRLDVQRKQAHRPYTVYWDPFTRQLEPIRCSACGLSSYRLAFTNDDVLALCAACSDRK